jgi:hypothetical protein
MLTVASFWYASALTVRRANWLLVKEDASPLLPDAAHTFVSTNTK